MDRRFRDQAFPWAGESQGAAELNALDGAEILTEHKPSHKPSLEDYQGLHR